MTVPGTPSTEIPAAFWKTRIAAWVAGPTVASTASLGLNGQRLSWVWTVATGAAQPGGAGGAVGGGGGAVGVVPSMSNTDIDFTASASTCLPPTIAVSVNCKTVGVRPPYAFQPA